MAQLKDVCKSASSNIVQKDLENNNGEYPIFGASGLIKYVDFYKQSREYIAVVKDGAGVGRIMKCPAFSSVIGTMQYIIPNDNIDINYLSYVMEYMNLSKYYTGATIPHIYFKDYKNESFNLPDYAVQKKIANIFDKINGLICERKNQLEKLEKLVKVQFVETFGDPKTNSKNWMKEKLSAKMEVRGRVGWKGYKKEDLREDGPIVIGAAHLSDDGKIDLSEPVYLSMEKYLESPEIMIKQNDLIFAQRGSLGKIGLIEEKYEMATINPCVLILRPFDINPQFARYLLMVQKDNGELDKLNSGSTIPMITQKSIGDFNVIVPPIELQNEFADFVKQVDKSKFEVQQSLEKFETLKKSLMQQYFGRGEKYEYTIYI